MVEIMKNSAKNSKSNKKLGEILQKKVYNGIV